MIYPGASVKLLPQNATAAEIVPRQVIFHTAVSTASSLYGWFASGAGGAHTQSHFYVDQSGRVEQYMDTERKAAAQWDGNAHGVSIETWDGRDPAHTPWNPAQVASLCSLGKWLSAVHSIPVAQCPGPQAPGFGWHELFGEWNKSHHSCPGQLREAQVPQILALIQGDDDMPGPVEELHNASLLVEQAYGDRGQKVDATGRAYWACRIQNPALEPAWGFTSPAQVFNYMCALLDGTLKPVPA